MLLSIDLTSCGHVDDVVDDILTPTMLDLYIKGCARHPEVCRFHQQGCENFLENNSDFSICNLSTCSYLPHSYSI